MKSKVRRTELGVLKRIYRGMAKRDKVKNREPHQIELEPFIKWAYENGYKSLYDNWVKSDCHKDFRPSVDRIDNSKGYTFDNMDLTTWKINRKRAYRDIKLGKIKYNYQKKSRST